MLIAKNKKEFLLIIQGKNILMANINFRNLLSKKLHNFNKNKFSKFHISLINHTFVNEYISRK